MAPETLLDRFPAWALLPIVVALVLLCIEAGHRLGDRRRRLSKSPEGPIGTVVGATLGLLAFVLAFTFGATSSRFDSRKELLLDEVNAIETTFLRAGLLLEPQRGAARALLQEYVDVRASVRMDALADQIARSEAIQGELWSQAAALAEADRSSEIDALFIAALNEMLDLHTKRVTVGIQYRLPTVIWAALFFVLVLAMAVVGYQFGLAGSRGFAVSCGLALTFSAVLLLIVELDRGGRGVFKASQQPMLELQQRMRASGP